MGFFTTDFGLGEEYANPKVSQTYQPSGGGGATSPALTSRQAAADPLSQLAKAMGGSTSGGYGGSGTNSLTDIASMLAGSSNMVGGGFGGSSPDFNMSPAVQPVTYPYSPNGDSNDGDDYSLGMLTGGTGGAFSPTAEDYQSYLSNRNWLQGAMNMFMPTGNIVGAAMDYNMGINPTPFGPTFMQHYTGPGFSGEYTGGIMTASDQRDQLIEQISFDPEGASWFGGNFMGYDPDSDLSLGPWSESTPVANYNYDLVNQGINPYTGQVMTQEYVVPSDNGTFTEMATGEYGEAGFTQEEADFASSFDDDSDYSDDGDYGGYGDDSDDGGDGWSGDDFGW
jgi:hypothetical protein